MQNELFCIDVGSTSIKYALYDGIRRRGEGSVPFPLPVRQGGGIFEVSAQEIAEAVKTLVRGSPAGCGVLISVQMHGHILSERAGTYVSWRDTRAARGGAFARYLASYGALVGAQSGTRFKENLAVCSLLSDNESGLCVRGELFSLGSYLAHALTGNNVSHESDLAALGFYLRGAGVNEALLAALPFRLTLPVCTCNVQPCGTFGGRTVFTPVGDQQCSVAALGSGGAAVLNVGTAAQICRIAKGFCAGDFESRPYFAGDTLCTCTGLAGGALLAAGGADAEALIGSYLPAFRAVGAQGRVLCTGGAFAYHARPLLGAVRGCGLVPEMTKGDAIDGLLYIFKEYVCKKEVQE